MPRRFSGLLFFCPRRFSGLLCFCIFLKEKNYNILFAFLHLFILLLGRIYLIYLLKTDTVICAVCIYLKTRAERGQEETYGPDTGMHPYQWDRAGRRVPPAHS